MKQQKLRDLKNLEMELTTGLWSRSDLHLLDLRFSTKEGHYLKTLDEYYGVGFKNRKL